MTQTCIILSRHPKIVQVMRKRFQNEHKIIHVIRSVLHLAPFEAEV